MTNCQKVPKVLMMLVASAFFAHLMFADESRALPSDILSIPVLLKSEEGGKASHYASGFYYRKADCLYFVTARHVLFSDSSVQLDVMPNRLPIPSHPADLIYRLRYDRSRKTLVFSGVMSEEDKTALTQIATHESGYKQGVEQLYRDSQHLKLKFAAATLFSHPTKQDGDDGNVIQVQLTRLLADGNVKYHPSSDVVVVKIGVVAPGRDGGTSIKLNEGVSKLRGSGIAGIQEGTGRIKLYDEVSVGNSVFSFGYPASVSSRSRFLRVDLPLLRSGIVAGKSNRLRMIILDCPAYQGNSGGLVLEVQQQPSSRSFKAIGMITNMIPFDVKGTGELQNSGYSVALPMDTIVELMKD